MASVSYHIIHQIKLVLAYLAFPKKAHNPK